MWVTQSYLGEVEPDAAAFVYYLYLDYRNDQSRFTEDLQRELEDLGDVFGGKVSLSMPNPRYAGRIEAEVREIGPVWQEVHNMLPGLLLSTVPMSKIPSNEGSCVFVPFKKLDSTGVAEAAASIKKLADNAVAWKESLENSGRQSLSRRLLESIEFKPGVFGFRIDLRKLFR